LIKNRAKIEKFEKNLIKNEKLSHKAVFRLFDELHKEAVLLGIINSKNIMEGIEVDLRIAKILNKLH
jgi:hypothetical protein